jgi:hypothetical protein
MIYNKNITMVEEIIRDGSYVVDFKLERDGLYRLASLVDGIDVVGLIDVGPGTGLGTRSPKPVLSDREHLEVVTDAVNDTGLTTFLLTGVATEREVELLAEYCDYFEFVRIGVDVDAVTGAEELLELTANLDIRVSLNLLKTYLSSPEEALSAAEYGIECGAEGVYIVDSAGGLRPHEVADYVETIHRELDVDVGFHGHDNNGNGLQNTATAIDCGATYVDSSIQGIGRSAGNVPTEHLLGYLAEEDERWEPDWDHIAKLEAALSEIYPGEGRVLAKHVLYGRAKLHSSIEDGLQALAVDHDMTLLEVLKFAIEHDFKSLEHVRRGFSMTQNNRSNSKTNP